MKSKLILVMLAGLFILPLSVAPAQAQNALQVNCAGLKDLPALCFKNNSSAAIVRIVTSNSMAFGTDAIETNIPPGWVYVIKMNAGWGGCKKYMKVWTADGKEHVINKGNPVDTCSNTTVNVSL